MNARLGSGDEALLPLLAGFGAPEAGQSLTNSGVGGTYGLTYGSTAAAERVARIAQAVISGGYGPDSSQEGGGPTNVPEFEEPVP